MRCLSCNCSLTDFEATRRSIVTMEFYDLCNRCFKTVREDLVYRERMDLMSTTDIQETEDIDIHIENEQNEV